MAGVPKVYGVRKTAIGDSTADAEVHLVSGWVPWEMLAPRHASALRSKVDQDLAERGLFFFDLWVLDWGLPQDQGSYQGQGQGRGQDDSDGNNGDQQDQQGESQGEQGESQGDNDNDNDNGESQEGGKVTTMEDLVDKRIKLRVPPMIDENNALVMGEVDRRITVLEDKVSNGTFGGSDGPIVRIEIREREQITIKDGLYHHQFPKLLKAVQAGKHCYLPGPPGSGKSHAAFQVAEVLGWKFGSISLGPTTPESRIWGGKDANGNFHEPAFVQLARYAMENPDSGAVFCEDELDNAHAGIMATQNSALANGFFTAPNNDHITWGNNFVVVGSANTYGTGPTAEFSGRNRLDAATLDRFVYLPWETDLATEKILVTAHLDGNTDLANTWLDVWNTARANVKAHSLKVFVTMRGAINGADLLMSGFDLSDALDMVLLNKLPEDQAKKVNPL
jgi:hypothetical protein